MYQPLTPRPLTVDHNPPRHVLRHVGHWEGLGEGGSQGKVHPSRSSHTEETLQKTIQLVSSRRYGPTGVPSCVYRDVSTPVGNLRPPGPPLRVKDRYTAEGVSVTRRRSADDAPYTSVTDRVSSGTTTGRRGTEGEVSN